MNQLPYCVSIGKYTFTQTRIDGDGVQRYNIQSGTDRCFDYDHPFTSIEEMKEWVKNH